MSVFELEFVRIVPLMGAEIDLDQAALVGGRRYLWRKTAALRPLER